MCIGLFCRYFDPKPKFYYFDDLGGSVCHISLPSNAPLSQITSKPQPSNEAAKKDACLKAIEELHKLGALSDYLLLEQDNVVEEDMVIADPDLDSFEGLSMRYFFLFVLPFCINMRLSMVVYIVDLKKYSICFVGR